jgi:hypothetical protein
MDNPYQITLTITFAMYFHEIGESLIPLISSFLRFLAFDKNLPSALKIYPLLTGHLDKF